MDMLVRRVTAMNQGMVMVLSRHHSAGVPALLTLPILTLCSAPKVSLARIVYADFHKRLVNTQQLLREGRPESRHTMVHLLTQPVLQSFQPGR